MGNVLRKRAWAGSAVRPVNRYVLGGLRVEKVGGVKCEVVG